MCVGYCSLKIFEFTKTNSYGREDNWVTPRLVTEKARNDPEGKFAFPPPHRIAGFARFFVTTFAVYLPKELLSPAAATRAAACEGKVLYIQIFATTSCLCPCFCVCAGMFVYIHFCKKTFSLSLSLSLCEQVALHRDL